MKERTQALLLLMFWTILCIGFFIFVPAMVL